MKGKLAIIFITAAMLFSVSCKKSKDDEKEPAVIKMPAVSTDAVTGVGMTTVICNSSVLNDGGSTVTSRGLCWSLNPNPTVNDFKLNSGTGTGSFTSKIKALLPNTLYHLRAFAGNSVGIAYGNNISFSTVQNPTGTVCDADGNIYHTVKISNQEWLVENLRTSSYVNGDSIPNIQEVAAWGVEQTGAWCYYNNDPSNNEVFGKLYNWHVIKDSRKIAPVGWHVASNEEWMTLFNFLGGTEVACGKLKDNSVGWNPPNVGATNEVGFCLRGSGIRDRTGLFLHLKNWGYYWASTELGGNNVYYQRFGTTSANVDNLYWAKDFGYSIRCIKD